MKKILIVGGANGIGLSIATELAKRSEVKKIYIVDKCLVQEEDNNQKFETYEFDLTNDDYSIFDTFMDIDTLMITAGFGRLSLFRDLDENHIKSSFNVNTVSVLRIIKHFYHKLEAQEDFYCGVMVSISGFMSSPFFSIYAATKAALKVFIESVNVELLEAGTANRILNVSPGKINGTGFYGKGKTNVDLNLGLANEIIAKMESKEDLFIPQYEEIYKNVLQRYHDDFRKEGRHSYEYKLQRLKNTID